MNFAPVLAISLTAAIAIVPPAFAGQQPAGALLPGVTRPEPIVKPLAEPPELARKDENGFVRMGNWDVKISGSVRVDIRAGTFNRPPR